MKNTPLRAIIVDDEPHCIGNLQEFTARCCDGLTVVGTASTVTDAQALLRAREFEVAFLDIQMANQTAFDFIQDFPAGNHALVFVTAYEQYALKAFGVGAVDYLLKPLNEPDVIRAYARLQHYFRSGPVPPTPPVPEAKAAAAKVILAQGDRVHVVAASDLLYLQGSGFYTSIYFQTPQGVKKVMVSKPLSVLEQEYAFPGFFRIHKSYIINTNRMATLVRTPNLEVTMPDGTRIPVARRRATEFLDYLRTYGH